MTRNTTSQSFKHSVLKGSDRESAVADFLRQRLPSRFAVTTGEVIDQGGRRSPQLDVVIYDGSAAAPILPADREGGAEIIGAEALLATVEVKSKLTRADIRQAAKSVKTLYSMRPFGNGWGIETHREVPFKPTATSLGSSRRFLRSRRISPLETGHRSRLGGSWQNAEIRGFPMNGLTECAFLTKASCTLLQAK